MPINKDHILPTAIIMDIKYRIEESLLLQEAAKKKAQIVFGSEMFINQAVLQEQVWFKEKVDATKVFKIMTPLITTFK